jgi:hypothetical protein
MSDYGGVIRWQDPPPAKLGQTGKPRAVIGHELIAVQLRRRPGVWGVVQEVPFISMLATYISRGKYAPYRPAGSFEATTRLEGDVHVVYARYVGAGGSDA